MGHWLEELQENLPEDTVLHLVGTKADMVTEDPTKRAIAFETCVAYAAEHLYPASQNSAAPGAANASLTPNAASRTGSGAHASLANLTNVGSPHSNRSSMGFWGLDLGWDSCHEVSASSGEGVEEVFRVITRRLVEQRAARSEIEREMLDDDEDEEERREGQRSGNGRGGGPRRTARDWAGDGAGHPYGAGGGSFRVGIGDKRRSWLGLPQFPGATEAAAQDGSAPRRRGPCCGG
jgi:GTPase SAR1 family protein